MTTAQQRFTLLYNRGGKEPEDQKVATATLVRLEREARTLELISSFADMAGASSTAVIQEALESLDLTPRLRDTLTGLLDMETSRGHATYHAMQIASTMDGNLKLLRRKGILENMTLSTQLKTAAYWLPFHPAGSKLFSDGISKVLEAEEDMAVKKHTRSFAAAMIKSFVSASTGARPKIFSPPAQSQRGRDRGTPGRGSHRGGGNQGKGRGRGGSKGPSQPKASSKRGNDHKGDKGSQSSS